MKFIRFASKSVHYIIRFFVGCQTGSSDQDSIDNEHDFLLIGYIINIIAE